MAKTLAPRIGRFDMAFAAVAAAIADPMLSAEGFCATIAKQAHARIENYQLPTEREASILHELSSFEKAIRQLRGKSDAIGLRLAAVQFQRAITALTTPAPIPSIQDMVRSIHGGLQSYGWSSATIDLLLRHLRPGERSLSYDGDKLVTTARTIVRTELIRFYRPQALAPNLVERYEANHRRPDHLTDRPAQSAVAHEVIQR